MEHSELKAIEASNQQGTGEAARARFGVSPAVFI